MSIKKSSSRDRWATTLTFLACLPLLLIQAVVVFFSPLKAYLLTVVETSFVISIDKSMLMCKYLLFSTIIFAAFGFVYSLIFLFSYCVSCDQQRHDVPNPCSSPLPPHFSAHENLIFRLLVFLETGKHCVRWCRVCNVHLRLVLRCGRGRHFVNYTDRRHISRRWIFSPVTVEHCCPASAGGGWEDTTTKPKTPSCHCRIRFRRTFLKRQ